MKNPFKKSIKASLDEKLEQLETSETGPSLRGPMRLLFALALVLIISISGLGFYWSHEPNLGSDPGAALTHASLEGTQPADRKVVTGTKTIEALTGLGETLLNKPGGYLSNDRLPPGVFLDNLPNWEFGVLVQIRDLTRALRNNLSRSQSQSSEDADLVDAENQFYFDNDSWFLPATEGEYRQGLEALKRYHQRLSDPKQQQAQFYARADNLSLWLGEVETRLGSLSQRLSASVGKRQLDTGLAGDSAATQSTKTTLENEIKTPWLELDDVFYEARGSTWALIQLLRAVEADFAQVLEKKNAKVSLQQIIRELEPTQDTLWSPVILNGSGLGILANHSLVMASHISRANAAISDLRRLLEQG